MGKLTLFHYVSGYSVVGNQIFSCSYLCVGALLWVLLIASVSVMLHLLTTDVAEDLISLVAMERSRGTK